MGWVMEEDVDGWRITGVVLKKKGMTEVVQKLEADKAQRQSSQRQIAGVVWTLTTEVPE